VCATLFSFYLSRNCRHSETQIWLTNSFFFVCCDFWGNSPIGKINFFLALFFSLFRCCVFWPFIARYFFCEKKSKVPTTMSHSLIFEKKLIFSFSFNFFSWLDWGHSTASNQLQIFLKIFFSMRTKEVCCDLFWIWPFSVWVQTLRILSME